MQQSQPMMGGSMPAPGGMSSMGVPAGGMSYPASDPSMGGAAPEPQNKLYVVSSSGDVWCGLSAARGRKEVRAGNLPRSRDRDCALLPGAA
jgi:hypothetical protein